MPSGAITGVTQGASAGAAFGPWGAVIGAVAGGLLGLGADKQAAKARKYTKKANALRTDATILRSFAEQRVLLRQAQLARATGLASGVASGAEIDSSGTQGVLSSVRNQMFDNFLLGESILNEQLDANVYQARAGDAVNKSQDIMGYLSLGAQLSQLIPQRNPSSAPNSAPDLNSAFDTTLITPGGIQTVQSGGAYNA